MRSKNITIIIVFLLFMMVLIFYHNYFYNNISNRVVQVIMNDEGFSPDNITIPKGTTVTWTNEGERPHWPASNFHPNHTLYPESGGCTGSSLDACRGLLKGKSFSFKFDILGKWPMHDHLFPGLIMVVEVVDQKDYKEKSADAKVETVAIPAISEFRALDYGKQMEVIKSMSANDPAGAWAYLKNNFIVNDQVMGNAHEFAHIVGNKSFEKFGLDGIKICDTAFAFGCFHGVTEMMLLTEGLKNIKIIEEGCLRIFPPDKIQNYTSCIHGTGHGVYSFEGGDLKKALTDCDIISEPNRQYCYDGVFMENSSTPEARIFDDKNPWKFCSDLDERYHRNCARYQIQGFLSRSGSLDLVGKNCALGPSILLRETCYESLGYHIAQSSLGKASDILKGCQKMPNPEGMEICITGGAIESIFQRYASFENSVNLCRNLTEPRQSVCFSSVNRMISQ